MKVEVAVVGFLDHMYVQCSHSASIWALVVV